jgi:hypothetical protein
MSISHAATKNQHERPCGKLLADPTFFALHIFCDSEED